MRYQYVDGQLWVVHEEGFNGHPMAFFYGQSARLKIEELLKELQT